jgi:hypothetical protein
MKKLTLSSNVPHGNWQILGEREQAVEAGMDAKIQAWLTEILHPLLLPTDFLNRILKSAQDSATRALQTGIEMKFEYIYLKVFTSERYISNEKTWGFFQIDKIGTPVTNTNIVDHSIEFYLYREG